MLAFFCALMFGCTYEHRNAISSQEFVIHESSLQSAMETVDKISKKNKFTTQSSYKSLPSAASLMVIDVFDRNEMFLSIVKNPKANTVLVSLYSKNRAHKDFYSFLIKTLESRYK